MGLKHASLLIFFAVGLTATGAERVAAAGGRDENQPVHGRFVRVEGAAKDYLHFAELEVYVNGKNVAVGKRVKASSTMGNFTPEKAVDGVVQYTWGKDASLWSSSDKGNQWWELDLGGEVAIEKITLWNRLDCCQERLAGAGLSVLKSDRSLAFEKRLDASMNPNETIFFERPLPPVNLTGVTLTERIASVCPRFDKPSGDAAYVMPVGTGDLSAMVRFDGEIQIHLSKTDFAGFGNTHPGNERNLLSPGHVRLAFKGVTADNLTKFSQQIDFLRGSVKLAMSTAEGDVNVEIFGVMGTNVLTVAIKDSRAVRGVMTEFSVWRPAMSVKTEDAAVVTREVHDYDVSGKTVVDPARVSPDDIMFKLGSGTVMAFADKQGPLAASSLIEGDATNQTARLTVSSAPSRYWLIIASETSYDGQPEALARAALARIAAADKDELLRQHLVWWDRYWQASFLDLYGKDAELLMRLWYTSLYSFGCVGNGPLPPKFNGGPGLVAGDSRSWGMGYWWQNTRELMWPMYAANHLEFVKTHIDFYDRFFARFQGAHGKTGIALPEGAMPVKPGATVSARKTTPFSQGVLNAAIANLKSEHAGGGYGGHIFSQGAEFVQLMSEYAAHSGDEHFLREVFSPWLHEVTLFYLSYLKQGADGRYHMEPSDSAETWWKVRDPMTDMAGIRYCFWTALAHGAEFAYEPDFLETVRSRLKRLAPLPTGRWKIGADKTVEIERTDAFYAPAGDVLEDRSKHNQEHPELYLVYPFALVDFRAAKADYERAVNTFKIRLHPNWAGWSPCGVQAARLRLPDTVQIIMDHVRRQQKYPYGGWDNVGNRLKGSALNVSDAPYFDTAGVNLTALQETLLQSHRLTAPDKSDLLGGGPLVLLPAVPKDWAGRFKLHAAGGFLVTVQFQPDRRIERLTVLSERGTRLSLVNPFAECRVRKGDKEILSSREATINLPTGPGDVFEFAERRSPNP